MTEKTALQEWKSHWTLLVASLVGSSFYAVMTYSFGTFILPLETEFGWNRASISFGLTIFSGMAVLGGPFIGALLDQWGTRKIAVFGIGLHAAAFAALSTLSASIYHWYALWFVIAVIALSTKSLIWSTAVSSVFSVSRSLALGVMLCGTAIGQMSPLLAGDLIESHGWRTAYIMIGAGWGGLALILVLLFFRDARELGKRAGGVAVASGDLPGLTIQQAVRDSRILRIGLANLFLAIVGGGVTVHLVPILSGAGITRGEALAIAATAGLAGIAGKLGTGLFLDKVKNGLVPFVSFAVSALGFALLLYGTGSKPMLTTGVMLLGFSSGAGLQVTTYLVSRYAGLRSFGKVFGTIGSAMMLGTAVGPVIAGHLYDVSGNYSLLLAIGIPIYLVCSLLFLGLGPYPDFTRPNDRREPVHT